MIRLKEGFVINPDIFWRPAYRISPFNTGFNSINKRIIDRNRTDADLIQEYFGKSYFPTINGRAAISIALMQYDLKKGDEIAIITTSGNTYISSCVTSEIEKVCKWSMEITDNTKLIFVNHEFGFMYSDLQSLKAYGLPIIEDKALSFASNNPEINTKPIGDFVIYSLPKFFPVSFGGVLQCNNAERMKVIPELDGSIITQFNPLMTHYLSKVDNISKKRLDNYQYLTSKFSTFGFTPYFTTSAYNVPGVFIFKTSGLDLPGLKKFMQSNGIESSVFYGKEAFFVPVHQHLESEDMDLFYLLTLYFLENGSQ